MTLTAEKPKPYAYPKVLRTLGEHLRKKRLDKGLLQRELAKILGVDEMTIVNWELNHTQPRRKTKALAAIIGFLGYNPSLDYMAGEQKPK